jgi:hypothetical protein
MLAYRADDRAHVTGLLATKQGRAYGPAWQARIEARHGDRAQPTVRTGAA